MCVYVHKIETNVSQNLINHFWLSKNPSIGRILSEKKHGGTGLHSEKTEALHVELKQKSKSSHQ